MKNKISPLQKPLEQFEKVYILPPWRSKIAGVILIIVGLALTFMNVSLKNSLWRNLEWIFIDFSEWSFFFVSLLILPFKIGLIIGGYFYYKYSDGVVRAKLDQKGFYYQTIPKGTGKFNILSIDLSSLTFVGYQHIRNIEYKKSSFRGDYLELQTDKESVNLLALDALRNHEKREIAALIKQRINSVST